MNYFQPPECPGTVLSTSSCIFPQSSVVCADQPNTLGQQKLEGPPHVSIASLHATPFSPYYTANSGHPGSLHVSQKASFRYSHTAACKLLQGGSWCNLKLTTFACPLSKILIPSCLLLKVQNHFYIFCLVL